MKIMKIMKKIVLLCLLFPIIVLAQEKGTHFEYGLSWKQVKEKARVENKFLLVDCYTTWCGPCKYMSSAIFPQEKVGDFFNRNFVNVKVQFDKTKEDSEEVKNWYADADIIRTEFKVEAYPTFLIFSPEGKLVHRIVGASKAEEFIAKAEKGLQPESQYYTLLKKYDSDYKSPEYIKQLIFAADEAYYKEKAEKLASEYLATQKDLYTKANLEILSRFIKNSKSLGFQTILKNQKKATAVLGADRINNIMGNVILDEEIFAYLNGNKPNLDSLIKVAKVKYPSIDFDKPSHLYEVKYYQNTSDWSNFQIAVFGYMRKYGKDADVETLNNFAWGVFESSKSPEYLAEALVWSKRCVEETQSKEPGVLDTYANLLYKMGKREEAISVLQEAITLLSGNIKKENYEATLVKMQKGEKTWVDK